VTRTQITLSGQLVALDPTYPLECLPGVEGNGVTRTQITLAGQLVALDPTYPLECLPGVEGNGVTRTQTTLAGQLVALDLTYPLECLPGVEGNGVTRTQTAFSGQLVALDPTSFGLGPEFDSENCSAATLYWCCESESAVASDTETPSPSHLNHYRPNLCWTPQNRYLSVIEDQCSSGCVWLVGLQCWVLDPFPRVGIGTTHIRSEQAPQCWPPGYQRGTRPRRAQSCQTSPQQRPPCPSPQYCAKLNMELSSQRGQNLRQSNLRRPGSNPFGLNWRSRSWLSFFRITRLSMLDVGIDGPFLGTGSPFSYFGISFLERLLVLFSISLTVFRLLQLPSSSSTCPLFVFGSRVAPVAPWPRNWKKRRAREQESRSYHWWRNLEIGILGVTYVVFPLPSKDTEDLSDEEFRVKSHFPAQQHDLSNGRMRNMFSLKNFVSVFIYILYHYPPVSFVLGSPAREGARHE
jgi:hypothetical protein